MNSDDLFTAPQVAKICSTDLKTIHNWVNRGEIKYFRTPGRHLRFRRQDIMEFLSRYGYPVPEGFELMRPRVVVIDSSAGSIEGLKKALADDADLDGFTDHLDALLAIGRQLPSMVLVNGTCDPDMMRVVARIKSAERDLPVAVYGGSEENRRLFLEAGAIDHTEERDSSQIRRLVVRILGAAR